MDVEVQAAAEPLSYDATFRIWAALNQPGGLATLAQVDPSAVNMQFEGSPEWTVSTGQPTGTDASIASNINLTTLGATSFQAQPSGPPTAHLGTPALRKLTVQDILTMGGRGPSLGGSPRPSSIANYTPPWATDVRSVAPYLPPGTTVTKTTPKR